MIISLPFHRPSQLQIITANWPVSNYTECFVTRAQRCEQLAPSYYAPNKESTDDPLITSPTTDLLCHHAKPPQITKSLSVLINKVKKSANQNAVYLPGMTTIGMSKIGLPVMAASASGAGVSFSSSRVPKKEISNTA